MKNKLALIDADSLGFYSSKETIEDSIFNLKERIDTIVSKTESTHFILCLTGSDCFRYKIYPEYKQTRKESAIKYPQKLKYLKTLKSLMIEEYNALLIQELEADDVVAYYNYNLPDYDTIISSPDKDVIHQLVGTHYNYGKGEFVTTTQKMGDRFLALQLLIGDVTDNVKGLGIKTDYVKKTYGLDNRKGIGESTANKILDIMDEKGLHYSTEILRCYISKYEGENASESGYFDYNLNRHLLQLQTSIGRYNKILENYDISEHIQEVKKEIIKEIDDF